MRHRFTLLALVALAALASWVTLSLHEALVSFSDRLLDERIRYPESLNLSIIDRRLALPHSV